MSKQLKASVMVNGTVYEAGSTPPPAVAKEITNPDAWEGADVEQSADVTPEPPRSGAGSGVDAWRAYAAAVGVAVNPDATREDIIAAVEAQRSSSSGD